MKRMIQTLFIVCVIVTQKHIKGEWLTECKNQEMDGFVILDSQVVIGRAVSYSPFIKDPRDEYAHGKILGISEAIDPVPQAVDTTAGKEP